eukprot:Skav233209  [mRNA]  locus=scaffold1872:106996:108471:- [translate_table: standard]
MGEMPARDGRPKRYCVPRMSPRMGLKRYSILSATKYWPLVSGWFSSGARQNLHPAPYRGMVWAVSSNVLFLKSFRQNSAKRR